MPVIDVKGIPVKYSQTKLERLCCEIIKSTTNIEELEINADAVSVFFPADRMRKGLGEEIVITVSKLFIGPGYPKRTRVVFEKLAWSIAHAVKVFFPKAMVECSVEPLDLAKRGFALIPAKTRR